MRGMLIGVAVAAVSGSSSWRNRTSARSRSRRPSSAGNFYTLEGSGGTIGVLAGPDGVFMVDTQFAPLGDKIVAAIKQISDGRIRYPGQHARARRSHRRQREHRQAGRDDLRAREPARAAGEAGAAGQRPAGRADRRRWPADLTYDAPLTFHMNGEDVQLIPVPVAHTDGDTMVYFPNANVIMTGDFYRSTGYPNIDRANGGTMNGMLDGLRRDHRARPSRHEDLPGHGAIVDKTAVAAHKAMMDGGARQGGGAGAPEQDAGRGRRREADGRLRREGHRRDAADRRSLRRPAVSGAQEFALMALSGSSRRA